MVFGGDDSGPRTADGASGRGHVFSHFTTAEGVRGITGVTAEDLALGQSVVVNRLSFGYGSNTFMALHEGDIFVTDLAADVSGRRLASIGVFGDKQRYAIQFLGEEAAEAGVVVRGVADNIYVVPGGTTLEVRAIVIRLR
jgi:hypothetical protein